MVFLLLSGACRPPQEATGGKSPTPPAAIQESPAAPSPQAPAGRIEAPPGTPEELKKIFEVWSILSKDFVDQSKLDPKKGSTSAIEGIIKTLDDPYTTYISAEDFDIDRSGFEGSFEGIGAVVSMDQNQLTIVSPFDGSPAAAAGIRPGDIVLEIDGVSTQGMSVNQAVNKIRGPNGTKVTLNILHVGDKEPVSITIVRGEIKVASVETKTLDNKVAQVRIIQFTQRTPDELRSALIKLKQDGMKGLVLDLRGNPGGLLDATVDVASQFLEDGLVLYEVDGKGNRVEWKTRRGGVALDLPLAVLVNKGSASGSEVLAGALQDRGRAPLIGTQTFGKGSVNILRRLSDGSGLYITIAHWYTPKGNLIEGAGLNPDIEVLLTAEDRRTGKDPQLDRAVQYVHEKLAQGIP